MTNQVDVAIIGAGPYGLSVAAYLGAAGIEHRVFGVPMESWQRHMPSGMYLKSNAEASSLFDPGGSFTLEDFSRERRFSYHPYRIPVALSDFVAYGKAFQQRFVPLVDPQRLLELRATKRGHIHTLGFDSGETVNARHVVLASGIVPFRYTPPVLSRLPAALVSHSADFGPLDRLHGKQVTILGNGSSALDIAALLSMRGSAVTIVARFPKLEFQPAPVGRDLSFVRRALRRAYAPPSHGLGDGWLMWACAAAPQLIHLLPDRLRFAILRNTLGPSGGHFIRDHIEKTVTLKLGRVVERADERGGRVRLTLIARDGVRETFDSDHVVAGTGYQVDLRRLSFLDEATLAGVRMADHTPILSSGFECSMPGLHFVGLAAARSFGPALRFVMGAVHPARRLAQLLPRSLLRRPVSMPAAIPN